MELGLLTVLLWKSELYKVFHIIFIGQFLCKFLGRVLLPSHLVSQWLVRGGPGALSPLLRLRPHLLISGPGLLIAEPMLLQQYGIYFFVSELIALVTVLKSHYYEAWFVVFSWFLQFYVYLWQNWNPVNFSFSRWIVWQIKCTNLVFGLSPPGHPSLKTAGDLMTISRPNSRMGRGYLPSLLDAHVSWASRGRGWGWSTHGVSTWDPCYTLPL